MNERLSLYFGTDAQSQKIRNIARDPRVSATVTPDYEISIAVQASSLAAEAERVTDVAEFARVAALVLEKFPRPGYLLSISPLEGLAVVRRRPAIVSVLDYATRFGQSVLIDLRDQAPPGGRDSRRP